MTELNNAHLSSEEVHFAAIIDENGKELPITEAMIEQACELFEEQE